LFLLSHATRVVWLSFILEGKKLFHWREYEKINFESISLTIQTTFARQIESRDLFYYRYSSWNDRKTVNYMKHGKAEKIKSVAPYHQIREDVKVSVF